MKVSRPILVLALPLILMACRGSEATVPTPSNTPLPDESVLSATAGRDTMWMMSVHQAQVSILSHLMPCIRAWELNLADKVFSMDYQGDGEWIAHLYFENSIDKPHGGELGSWLVSNEGDISPYSDGSPATPAEPVGCLATVGERAMLAIRPIIEFIGADIDVPNDMDPIREMAPDK